MKVRLELSKLRIKDFSSSTILYSTSIMRSLEKNSKLIFKKKRHLNFKL
jgi:hypothetical protein